MTDKKHGEVHDLIAKGDGVLVKRGSVWTYPGCANDTSGTNVVLPLEYVSDVAVQAALGDGALRAAVVTPSGFVSAVRLIDDDTAVVSAGLAGSPEVGTELPPNSRIEQDAGAAPTSQIEVERQVADGMKALTAAPVLAPAPAKAKR